MEKWGRNNAEIKGRREVGSSGRSGEMKRGRRRLEPSEGAGARRQGREAPRAAFAGGALGAPSAPAPPPPPPSAVLRPEGCARARPSRPGEARGQHGLCPPRRTPGEDAGTREGPGLRPPNRIDRPPRAGRWIDRRRGPRGGAAIDPAALPLRLVTAAFPEGALPAAGEAGISGSNWARRRPGTSAPRGRRGASSPQLGLRG